MRTLACALMPLCLCCACSMPAQQQAMSIPGTPQIIGEHGPSSGRETRHTTLQVASEAPDPMSFNSLLATIGALSHEPIYKDSRADLLIDGPETYGAMMDALAQAETTIYLETYIFADDEVGQKFARQLQSKAESGLTVCVIYDGLGSFGSTWSTVGSSNLDYRSFLHNDEINAVVLGENLARQLEAQFEIDIQASNEVTLEQWQHRPLGDRIAETFSWVVEYWL